MEKKQQQAKGLPRRGPRKRRNKKHKRRDDKRRQAIDADDFDSRHYGEKNPQNVDTTNPALVVEPVVSPNVFEGVAVWLVSNFVMRGGQQVSGDESTPYHARIYITQVLSTAAQGGEPLLQRAPRILGIIAAMLSRKCVTMYNGYISYNFNVAGTLNTSEFVQTGPAGASRINFGIKSSTDVVNGNIPLSDPPAATTPELGLKAVQFIFDYLERETDNEIFRQEQFPITEDRWTHDPSAFGYALKILGGGNYNVGGQHCTVGMESNIPTPAATVFVPYEPTVNLGRSAKYSYPTVGDANFMTGMFCTRLDEDEFSTKRHPTLKYIDFNEVVDICARMIARGQQQALNDEDYRRQFNNNNDFFLDRVQFPITFQRLKLLLRNLCMKIDPEGQLTGSTVFPVREVGNAKVFRNFVTGCGQGPYTGGTPLKFPVVFMEILAALKGKTMDPKQFGKSPLNWIPVFGEFTDDVLLGTEYTATQILNDVTTVLPTFPVDATESVINMVDGTVGNRLAWMNDAEYLADDALAVNNWFKDNAEFFVARSELSPDGGIAVLSQIAATNNVIDFGERAEEEPKKMVIYIPDEGKMSVEEATEMREAIRAKMNKARKKEAIAQNFYNSRRRISVTNFDKPLISVHDGMGQFVIRPVNNLTTVIDDTDNNTIQTMQGNNREYYISTEAQGVTRFADLGEEHQEIANLCVRNKYGPEDTDIKVYEKAAEDGEGGLIGDLIKGAGRAVTDTAGGLINAGIGIGVDRYGL